MSAPEKLLVHRGTRDSVNEVYGAATEAEILAQPCVQEALKQARESERGIWTEAWECARGSILDRCIPMRSNFDNDDINAVLSILDAAQPEGASVPTLLIAAETFVAHIGDDWNLGDGDRERLADLRAAIAAARGGAR